MSTSASARGTIIVLRRYEPVRKVSRTLKSFSITSRILVCRVETVCSCNPVISRLLRRRRKASPMAFAIFDPSYSMTT